MYEELAVLAVFTFLYSVVSGRLEKLPVSGPIIFVLVGLALGPLGLGWFIDDVGRIELKALVDITLALVLFLDASTADQSVIRRFLAIPTRMLLLGLPGAIALGTALAVVMFLVTTVAMVVLGRRAA